MTMGSGGIYGTPQQQVQFPLFAGKGFGMGPFANMYTRDPRQALAYNLMAQGASAAPVQHWTQGAARLAQALVGGLIDNRTREEYEGRNRKLGEDTKAIFAPVQMPANEMDNGGERPATLTEMLQRASQTANPDLNPLVQQLALGHATQQAEDSRFKSRLAMELEAKKAEREAQPETFGAPTAMRGPNGPVMVQVGNRGTVRPVTGYAPTDQTANTPASLQEWAAFQRMTPEQQAQYLTMKRANPYLNLGGQMVQPNPVQPGVAMGGFDKTLPPEQRPEVRAAQTAAVEGAKQGVAAASQLPNAEAEAQYTIGLVNDLVNHPGMSSVVGAPGLLGIPAKMGMPIPGTDEAGFMARLDQLGGRQFLQAFESLKGGGQITEIEGKKATDAISRLTKTGQSEAEYRAAAEEFKQIVNGALQRARAKAGQQPAAPPPANPGPGGPPVADVIGIKFLGFE